MKGVMALVLAGLQGLGSDESRERPVDRLTAMGAIQAARAGEVARISELNSLGIDLIAFKFGKRESSKQAAEEKLADVLAWLDAKGKSYWGLRSRDPRHLLKIAAWAIREWDVDYCPSCRGAKEISFYGEGFEGPQRMTICPDCRGTGKRRYSDGERADALGDANSRALAIAAGIIGQAEGQAVRHAREKLGR